MALILNIETATPVCSVALSEDGKLIALEETKERLSHAGKLTIFIENCLKTAGKELKDIDAVAVSKGPGSYTGLRIGLSTAKGICYALDKPLIMIDTLQAMATQTKAQNKMKASKVYFCPMIDARRMEVYCNIFDIELNPIEQTQALIVDKNAFQSYLTTDYTILFSGDGAEKCSTVIQHNNAVFLSKQLASATGMCKLSHIAYQNQDFEDIAYSEPFYLKAPNITTPKKRL